MLKVTKHHEPVSTAKALLALLVLAIVAVLFYKFISNEQFFYDDPEALRNYVIFTIAVAGFLVGLLYLGSNVTHKPKAAKKVVKAKTTKKKKK